MRIGLIQLFFFNKIYVSRGRTGEGIMLSQLIALVYGNKLVRIKLILH